jgi:hypothetical protein
MGLKKCYGVSANGFSTADRIQSLAAFGLHANLGGFDSELCSHFLPHPRDVESELGPLEPNCRVDIDDGVASRVEQFAHVPQEKQARSVLPAGRRVGEMLPDVAESGCPQQGIADGVGERVAIGMPDRPFAEWDSHSTQDQLAAGSKAVDVIAKANPERGKDKG